MFGKKRHDSITFIDFKVFTFGSDEELIAGYGSLEDAELAWMAIRDEFLERWNLWGMPQAWWRFEPGIPEDLRSGPALILTEADADTWRGIDLARRPFRWSRGVDPTPSRSGPFGD